MKKRINLLYFVAALVLFLPLAISAADPAPTTESKRCGNEAQGVFSGAIQGLDISKQGESQTPWRLEVPFGEISCVTLPEYINYLHQYLVGAAGILAVVMIMFAGYRWLFSQGNSQKISEAQDMIVTSVIGLVLALTSYLLLYTLNPATTTLSGLKLKTLSRQDLSALDVDSLCTWKQLFDNPKIPKVQCGGVIKTTTPEQEAQQKKDNPDQPLNLQYCMSAWCEDEDDLCILVQEEGPEQGGVVANKYAGGGCTSQFSGRYGSNTYPVDVDSDRVDLFDADGVIPFIGPGTDTINCGHGVYAGDHYVAGAHCDNGDSVGLFGFVRASCYVETFDGVPQFKKPPADDWGLQNNDYPDVFEGFKCFHDD